MDELSHLNELFAEIEARRSASPDTSYSAQLLADLPRAANKLGEEAVETVTAALTGSDEAVLAESADLIYHWMVVLAARGLLTVGALTFRRAAAFDTPPSRATALKYRR